MWASIQRVGLGLDQEQAHHAQVFVRLVAEQSANQREVAQQRNLAFPLPLFFLDEAAQQQALARLENGLRRYPGIANLRQLLDVADGGLLPAILNIQREHDFLDAARLDQPWR